jgi:Ca2+-binding RTX toxin-like protein
MAKLKFNAIYSTGDPTFQGTPTLDKHNHTRAEYFDAVSGNSLVVSGEHFIYKHGEIVKGTATSIAFENRFGDNYFDASHFHIKLSHFSFDDFGTLLTKILVGNDTVTGSTADDKTLFAGEGNNKIVGLFGDDNLVGLHGNDTYTGNLGSDRFTVGFNFGKDVITDFDANGGGTDQDYMLLDAKPVYKLHQVDADTVVDFGHGNSVTLLGVTATDITDDDFNFPM